ncbi:MAG TPA: N-acetyltransferase [Clostridiaceae bacterium]|nr:N-acetyltransferase [Clostridiaceae bacterium]
MIKSIKIRLAAVDDSNAILQIYAPYITNTAITFECKVPAMAEFRESMVNIQTYYPWLVCEIDNQIAGYAYASSFNEREAYQWSVDYSVYIAPEYHGRNIGKALYFALSETLKLQGFYNAYAIVTLPNIKSERLHESFGFKPVGVCHNAGYKFGRWHDVKWYELRLQEHVQAPAKPKAIDEISSTDEFNAIIEKAEQMIKTD